MRGGGGTPTPPGEKKGKGGGTPPPPRGKGGQGGGTPPTPPDRGAPLHPRRGWPPQPPNPGGVVHRCSLARRALLQKPREGSALAHAERGAMKKKPRTRRL